MNRPYTLWSIRGLLFVFDIENTHDLEREEIIVSKNVNDVKNLSSFLTPCYARNFLFIVRKSAFY